MREARGPALEYSPAVLAPLLQLLLDERLTLGRHPLGRLGNVAGENRLAIAVEPAQRVLGPGRETVTEPIIEFRGEEPRDGQLIEGRTGPPSNCATWHQKEEPAGRGLFKAYFHDPLAINSSGRTPNGR